MTVNNALPPNHKCAFCNKPVTEAAYNYCTSNRLPVTCYKCQYDKHINVYTIHQRMRHKGTEVTININEDEEE